MFTIVYRYDIFELTIVYIAYGKGNTVMKESAVSHLPEAELDVMIAIWSLWSGRGIYIGNVMKALEEKHPCSRATVHVLVERLAKRGFLRMDSDPDRRSAKIVFPLVSEEEYRAVQSQSLIAKLCGGSWKALVASLIDTASITDKDVDEIKAMLEKAQEGKK